MTIDRLPTFIRNVSTVWNGPMSLAIYLTSEEDVDALLSFFDSDAVQPIAFDGVTILRPPLASVDDRRAALRYPINALRNLALENAPTEHVLSLDADFVPSPAAHETLAKWSVPWLKAAPRRTAVVVPCFQLTSSSAGAPQSWAELKRAYVSGEVALTDAIAGHGPTRPSLSFAVPAVDAYTAHYGIGYETQMEPYVLMRRSEHPLYDERFTDQGGDKQAHALLLNALGTDFVVARGVWAMHPATDGKAPWPVDRARSEAFNETVHFSSAQRDQTRFRYFEHYVPELERAVGGATRLRFPRGRNAASVGTDRSFGRPSPGALFGM